MKSKIKTNVELNAVGKVPPQALDVEQVVLGACLLERDAFATAKETLNADCFYKDAHRMIFMAMEDLYRASSPIDLLTVVNKLKKSGELDAVGGPYAITELSSRVASAANLEYHCKIVFEKYILRKIISQSLTQIQNAYMDDCDPMEVLSEAGKTVDSLHEMIVSVKEKDFSFQVDETIKEIRLAKEKGSIISGLPTGFHQHDLITSGRSKGDLVILAARPGAGKTTCMLQEVLNIAVKMDEPVGIFSLEMPFRQLINKFLANMTDIDSRQLRAGQYRAMEEDVLVMQANILKSKRIHLMDVSGISISQIRSQGKVWKKKFGVKAIYVDYLQLVRGERPDGGNREQEIASISRGLKHIAMENNVPVIALSQLSREVEKRRPPKPQLSDLRESGSIENDSDVVEFLYRPDYYEKEPRDENGNDLRGLVERIVEKNRNGALGSTYCRFLKQFSRLDEIENMNAYFNEARSSSPHNSNNPF